MIEYRKVLYPELTSSFLSGFDRRQEVNLVWRKDENSEWVIKSEPFTEDWGDLTKTVAVINCLKNTLAKGGFVFAAFDGTRVAGFSSVEGVFIGSRRQYADLSFLHVSRESRNMGIGKKLFFLSADEAKLRGAEKLYISSHSAFESQAFYRGAGCVDALEPDKFHTDLEPFDCQLEYLIR